MASVGIGSLYVDSIVSSNPVISAAQGVVIAQGDTAQIPVTFYSEFSGIYEVDLTIYTSDPFESVPLRALHHFGDLRGRWRSLRHLVSGQQPLPPRRRRGGPRRLLLDH